MSYHHSIYFAAILTIAIFYYQLILLVASANLKVLPIWNTSRNTSQCFISNNEDIFNFNGNPYHTCSLQVTASAESCIFIEISSESISNEFFFYIEQIGVWNEFSWRYATLNSNSVGCRTSVFMCDALQLVLQGNTSVVFKEVPAQVATPSCQANTGNRHIEVDTRGNQTSDCCSVKRYNSTITCAIENDHSLWGYIKNIPGLCSLDFPFNCNVTLGSRRKVTFQCETDDDIVESLDVLMVYPGTVSNVKVLDLIENNIENIDIDAFSGLKNVQVLYLIDNKLTSLQSGTFNGMSDLKELYLFHNQLDRVDLGIFNDMHYLRTLSIFGNRLVALSVGAFQGLSNLFQLYLNINMLTILPGKLFQGLYQMEILHLGENLLESLESDLFQELGKLRLLILSTNNLRELPDDLFEDLQNLNILFLDGNQQKVLKSGLFLSLGNLELLELSSNKLMSLERGIFENLTKLKALHLSNNLLVSLEIGTFKGLINLNVLYLIANGVSRVDNGIFKDTTNLTHIDMSSNQMTRVPNFTDLGHLNFLNLRGNKLTLIKSDAFSSLSINTELFVDQHEICECYAPTLGKCSAANKRSAYLTCNRLLSDRVLMVMMWTIGLNALCGNMFVLFWRKITLQKNKIQDFLLSNLAFSDLLMGLYMIIIASADIHFGEHFPMQAEMWRVSIICRLAGALSILSSEASVFFVTLISVDRLVSIRFPYSTRKFKRKSIIATVSITWILSLILGVIPSSLANVNFKFYDISHVCVGLPLALTEIYTTTETTEVLIEENTRTWYYKHVFETQYEGVVSGLYFSTAMFLGLNGVCYMIVLACYVEIVKTVYRSSKRAGLKKEMKDQIWMTAKVAAIVATDFCCYCPILIMGILVQTRIITLPPSVFAWSVTFVLPINSAINPYLYTIAAIVSSWKHRKQQEVSDSRSQPDTAQGSTSQRRHTRRFKSQNTDLQTISTMQQQTSVSATQDELTVHPNVPVYNGTGMTRETNV